jgi:tetratricopeptide (TPR) repeat protein
LPATPFLPTEKPDHSFIQKTELTQMRFSRSRIGAIAVLVLFAGAGTGCGLVNKVRAKNELNEAARSYKESRFEDAEQHAKRALYLDPTNPTAPIFIARIIHQQYKPGVDQPDNIQRARDAIEAYKRVLEKDPNNDEAFRAISALYVSIKDDQKFRDWISARANDSNAKPEDRAEAYAVLSGKDWDCSFKVTELPDVKVTSTEGGSPKVTYKKPKEQKDFDTIQQCVVRGLQEAETAIKYDPNNDSAWSYKASLLIESAKLADMNGDADHKTQFTRLAETAQKRASELAEEKRKKDEAREAAAATPTP